MQGFVDHGEMCLTSTVSLHELFGVICFYIVQQYKTIANIAKFEAFIIFRCKLEFFFGLDSSIDNNTGVAFTRDVASA